MLVRLIEPDAGPGDETDAEHLDRSPQEAAPMTWLEPVTNLGEGNLVLARYRGVLEAIDAPGVGLCELVSCDVGRLWFPRFDRFMRPILLQDGTWETAEAEFLRSCVREGATVLNVGANVGYTTLLLSRIVGPSGRVIALEPETLNYRCLCANLALNGVSNVIPIHTAAGERTGSITLNYSPANAGDHRTANHPVAVTSDQVPVVALDDLIPSDLDIGAIVCDAQGYDHRILSGLTDVLERCRPPMLVEFWPLGVMEVGDDPLAVLTTYQSWGYRTRVVTTGEDVTRSSPEEILAISLDGRFHVNLGFLP
jgi:FkbM family methyltransferase